MDYTRLRATAYNSSMGQGGKVAAVLLSLALIALSAGCQGSEFVVGPVMDVIDLTGRYTSTEEIGALGLLILDIERVEETRVFRAQVSGALVGEVEPSNGIGTLGDLHLILNFDRGESSDFYYEGMVVLTPQEAEGLAIGNIAGQFVFPGQAETLPVVFRP
jgi:hypothetical protein